MNSALAGMFDDYEPGITWSQVSLGAVGNQKQVLLPREDVLLTHV